MARAVAYSLVATAIIFLLTLSPSTDTESRHLKASRRLGNKHAQFDPLVTQRERRANGGGMHEQNLETSLNDQLGWDTNVFSGVFEDRGEYFSDKGILNITGRLQILFPLLDRAPKDGAISLTELEAWNVWQANDQLNYRTRKAMEEHDRTGDFAITLSEYLPQFFGKNVGEEDRNHGQAKWWKEKFLNADIDGNGKLNFTELNDFLHPEDSNNEQVQLWLLKEKMRETDIDKDGKINFAEFHDQAYDTYKKYFEYESGETDAPNAQKKFAELDTDNDRLLTEEEVRPLISRLQPGEIAYAKYYTKHLINQADDDRDGKLTLDEMLDHPYIFYETVLKESDFEDDDLDDDKYFHDEL